VRGELKTSIDTADLKHIHYAIAYWVLGYHTTGWVTNWPLYSNRIMRVGMV